jgi:uncharacterized membrane protein HdeD (DUF308 family)
MMPKEMKAFNNKHKKCMEHLSLILGVGILSNIYLFKLNWIAFVGWVLLVSGLLHLIIPFLKLHKKR